MVDNDGRSNKDAFHNREARKIDHTYRDYSLLDHSEDVAATNADRDDANNKKGPTTNFPAKLHDIVSNSEYQHIICWMPHGRAWKVLNKQLLASVVCPYHFSHCSFDSFNRQVNGWGFKVCVCFIRVIVGIKTSSSIQATFLSHMPKINSHFNHLL